MKLEETDHREKLFLQAILFLITYSLSDIKESWNFYCPTPLNFLAGLPQAELGLEVTQVDPKSG